MFARLSLKMRLVLLFALLLTLGLSANMARMIAEAGPRIVAESQSSVRLGADFVRSILPTIERRPDTSRSLDDLVRNLRNIRHITIRRLSEGENDEQLDAEGRFDEVPSWLVTLIGPARLSTTIPISGVDNVKDAIVVSSNPLDEMEEIWSDLISQMSIDLLVAVVLLGITYLTVGRALAPVKDLAGAITRVREADYSVRVIPKGPPELADIGLRLNELVEILERTTEEKQLLIERVVTIEDDERRALARELHDEFGPYLFAIRAQASALAHLGSKAGAGTIVEATGVISKQIDALQSSNRRVLEKLRPVALDDLGLETALMALINNLRDAFPDVSIEYRSYNVPWANLSGIVSLTLYRVIQECLTNTFRHAKATHVYINIEHANADGPICIKVSDDGVGIPEVVRPGLGLRGMKERISALGGKLRIAGRSGEGTVVEALIPITSSSLRKRLTV
ncbi:hypothetical protein BA190_08615 [Labrys sp. WJW]|uniref:ATP-binding protein n=1 Tax=Labrys sp. WJW TaxID=1737983 RepID=UPI0008326E28|nr:ATP-binding protein [Labrys sp. WJW]OCC05468.1 hypothetical protein BA190_08615 [Labrys sp. WJW]